MSLSIPQAQYTGLSTDPKPVLIDAVVGTKYFEIDTKLVYFWTGTHWKRWKQLFKEGRWIGVGSTTQGSDNLFESNITFTGWTSTRVFDPIYGLHQQISTTNTPGSYAGIRTTNRYTEPRQNPYLRVVFALDTGGSLVGNNFFVGWSSHVASVGDSNSGADDIYPSEAAFGLKFRDGDTDFKLYHNDHNSVGGTIESTPIAPANYPTITSIHTIEMRVINGHTYPPTFQYKYDHAPSWISVTNDVPDNTSFLGIQIWMQTTIAAFKLFRLVDVYTRVDNKG